MNESNTSSFDITLETLNKTEAERRLPVIIYMSFLICLGVVGNAHVFIAFRGQYKKNSTFKVFVLFLAVVDTFTCVTTMPFELLLQTNPFMFYNDILCKLVRYLNLWLIGCSTFALSIIAFERYRRVCCAMRPQLSLWRSKILCVGAVLLAGVLSIPIGLLQGLRNVSISRNITATECSVSERYRGTKFHAGYSIGIIFVFFVITTSLIVSYSIIVRQIRIQCRERAVLQNNIACASLSSLHESKIENMPSNDENKKNNSSANIPIYTIDIESGTNISQKKNASPQRPFDSTHKFSKREREMTEIDMKDEQTGNGSISSQRTAKARPTPSISSLPKLSKTSSRVSRKAESRFTSRKVTYILFIITLVFILTFLPYVILEAMDASISTEFLRSSSKASIYHIVLRTYFINNVVNPFIYCFNDANFRQEIYNFYSKIRCCFCC